MEIDFLNDLMNSILNHYSTSLNIRSLIKLSFEIFEELNFEKCIRHDLEPFLKLEFQTVCETLFKSETVYAS